jgi:Transposase, Mutator family
VIIGATPKGKKELVGLVDGVRESAQSWRELLLDLKRRGLAISPECGRRRLMFSSPRVGAPVGNSLDHLIGGGE